MKRILLLLKEKWPEYLIEILVLIIGIYGAFELSNYGENRNLKRAELEILKGCKTELTTDLAEIKLNMEELGRSEIALNVILDVLENDGSYHDSLAFHFNYTLLPIHFVHSTSSFETAKSRGLDIISNHYQTGKFQVRAKDAQNAIRGRFFSSFQNPTSVLVFRKRPIVGQVVLFSFSVSGRFFCSFAPSKTHQDC